MIVLLKPVQVAAFVLFSPAHRVALLRSLMTLPFGSDMYVSDSPEYYCCMHCNGCFHPSL
ncbi:MAG: hypothetical protein JXA44_14065 [Methanospirillaceae archaeon]|nr:hypothetical protein [Methanospirillaceae archaeon]